MQSTPSVTSQDISLYCQYMFALDYTASSVTPTPSQSDKRSINNNQKPDAHRGSAHI